PQPAFSATSELVVLHVSVLDSRGRHVRGLGRDAFTVIEDGEPQPLGMFSGEDLPATIGLLIDNSASMRPHRERVIASALALTRNSRPDDEVFVLTFNEHVRRAWGPAVVGDTSPQLFSSSVASAITTAGMTAVYDAVMDGLGRVRRGIHPRQVLILISDGSDNASTAHKEEVIKAVHDSDATIYAVVVDDPLMRDSNPRLLRGLTNATGGALFSPRNAAAMPAVLEKIAQDIRSAYTLAYAPSRTMPEGVRRRIRVQARSPEGKALSVRARDGYFFKTLGGGPPHE
ncbi:MAG: VWA domain-containing protein, partial [Vicinamibacterales bacterium]